MARRKPLLSVFLSRRAKSQLDAIYKYNIEKRGMASADRYIAFLRAKIASLSRDYDRGKPVEVRPDLRYILMKPRSSGDGHLAVYCIDETTSTVDVMFVFHTRQDWENRL